jgi:large subunit ribosomal protein L29
MSKKQEIEPLKIREMSDDEIRLSIAKFREQVYRLRSQTVTEKVSDTSQFRSLRRNVARLRTEQSRRASAAS